METIEREKYDRIHSVPGYSPGPGLSHVRTAARYMQPGASVIDFGTGTGDAADDFRLRGFDAWAVDISRRGLRHDLGERFFQGTLWSLPAELPCADWGFCCDVMEHIPTGHVDKALQNIAGKVENCFFSISGAPDSWGKKIGDILHLTVKPSGWWADRLSALWANVEAIEGGGSVFIFVCKGAQRDH